MGKKRLTPRGANLNCRVAIGELMDDHCSDFNRSASYTRTRCNVPGVSANLHNHLVKMTTRKAKSCGLRGLSGSRRRRR